MGKLVGNEIVQSRTWVGLKKEEIKLDYKHAFPITVFDAVRESMTQENSQTLREVLDSIQSELKKRQPIIPNLPASNIVTYGGGVGEIDSIAISYSIPVNPIECKDDRIPTEKAVGDLLARLGLLDIDTGKVIDPSTAIYWNQIIGRPYGYTSLNENTDGYLTPKAIYDIVRDLQDQIKASKGISDEDLQKIQSYLDTHTQDINNPHKVTAEQLGAVTQEEFLEHLAATNPHNVSVYDLGLGNVDNTSDEDKPISKATQEALDHLMRLITQLADKDDGDSGSVIVNTISNITYDIKTCRLSVKFVDGSEIGTYIPINELVSDVSLDKVNRKLVVKKLNGSVKETSLSDVMLTLAGSSGAHIIVEIDQSESGKNVVRARIRPGSITSDMIDPDLMEIINNKVIVPGPGSGEDGDYEDKEPGFVLTEGIIETIYIHDGAVTKEKIAHGAIHLDHLSEDFVVNGNLLFKSKIPYAVLSVLNEGEDPDWHQIITEMITDQAITTEKIADKAITNDKIPDLSIFGKKLALNPEFQGTPYLTIPPAYDASDRSIPDTKWVQDHLDQYVAKSKNIAERAVRAEHIFSSAIGYEILAVLAPGANPQWSKIDSRFLIDDIIEGRHIRSGVVDTKHIKDGSITPEKLFTSDKAYKVLTTLTDGGLPVYSDIIPEMLKESIIGTKHLQDKSVTPEKLVSAPENFMIMGVNVAESAPTWMKIHGQLIPDKTIEPRHFFSSDIPNRLMGVLSAGAPPEWVQVNGKMIEDGAINEDHIGDGQITQRHLASNIIWSAHIEDRSISGEKLKYCAVGPEELFSSPVPDRVLAVVGNANEHPAWSKVTAAMLEDGAFTSDKFAPGDSPYTVLATTRPDRVPEYVKIDHRYLTNACIDSNNLVNSIMIPGTPRIAQRPADSVSNDEIPDTLWVRNCMRSVLTEIATSGSIELNPFIEDHSILGVKLVPSIQLPGTPTVEVVPDEDADGSEIVSTSWVRQYLANLLDPDKGLDFIPKNSITGDKLASTDFPSVIGIDYPNEDPHFLQIQDHHIKPRGISSISLAEHIELFGMAKIHNRPPDNARDIAGTGRLIPDCQWVLDRIEEAIFQRTFQTGCCGGKGIGPGDGCCGGCCGNGEDDEERFPPSDWREIPGWKVEDNYEDGGIRHTDAREHEITQDTVNEIWDTDGVGDRDPDKHELDDIDVKSEWYGWNLWLEIDQHGVQDAWDVDGLGDLTADPGEIDDDIVNFIWNFDGAGDTEANEHEISKETVEYEWRVGGVDSVEIDPEPGDFPGGNDPECNGHDHGCGNDNGGCGICCLGNKTIDHYHLKDRIVDGQKLFTSDIPGVVLGVINPGEDPKWTKILSDMLDLNIIKSEHIQDGAITSEKLANEIIERFEKIEYGLEHVEVPVGSIDDSHVLDHSITGRKLARNTMLPAYTTVEPQTDYEKKSVRNIIISHRTPRGGSNGDIWMQYY